MQEPSDDEKRRLAERAAAIEAKYAQAPVKNAAPSSELPAVRAVQDGDDSSLSVSDTNALRASLGLKPLTAGSASKEEDAVAEHRRHWDRKRSREQEQADREKREQLAKKKEERRIQNMLKKTRGLGALDGDDDNDFLVRPQALDQLRNIISTSLHTRTCRGADRWACGAMQAMHPHCEETPRCKRLPLPVLGCS